MKLHLMRVLLPSADPDSNQGTITAPDTWRLVTFLLDDYSLISVWSEIEEPESYGPTIELPDLSPEDIRRAFRQQPDFRRAAQHGIARLIAIGAFCGAVVALLAVFLSGCGGSGAHSPEARHVADTVAAIAAEVCDETEQAEACLVKCLDEYRRRKESGR